MSIQGEVRFAAQVSWSRSTQSLRTTVWAENTGPDSAAIFTGPCAFNVLAYTSDAPDARLVWHSDMPDNWDCPDVGLTYGLAPDEKKQLEGQLYISGNKWAHPVPRGEWHFELKTLTEDSVPVAIPAGRVRIR